MNLLSTVFAQANVDLSGSGISAANVANFTIGGILSWAITLIVVVAGLIFFFMLIIGGLKWVLSGGDKAQTESARGQITAALIGLVIIFSAWAIAKLVETVFGVNILNVSIPQINS